MNYCTSTVQFTGVLFQCENMLLSAHACTYCDDNTVLSQKSKFCFDDKYFQCTYLQMK